MRLDDSSHALLDTRLEPLKAWERNLRPANSPSLLAVTGGVLVVLAAALALAASWTGWRLPVPPLRPAVVQRTPPAGEPTPLKGADAPASPAGPAVQVIAKCMGRDGKAIYLDGACPGGTVAGSVEIRPDVNVADGMPPEARAASLRDNSQVAQWTAEHERQVAMNVDSSAGECAALEEQIKRLDAAARQPLPAYQQDQIREERKRARDRQFRLRCQ